MVVDPELFFLAQLIFQVIIIVLAIYTLRKDDLDKIMFKKFMHLLEEGSVQIKPEETENLGGPPKAVDLLDDSGRKRIEISEENYTPTAKGERILKRLSSTIPEPIRRSNSTQKKPLVREVD